MRSTNETDIAVIKTNVEVIKKSIDEMRSQFNALSGQFITRTEVDAIIEAIKTENRLENTNLKDQVRATRNFIYWLLGIVTLQAIGLLFTFIQNGLFKGG